MFGECVRFDERGWEGAVAGSDRGVEGQHDQTVSAAAWSVGFVAVMNKDQYDQLTYKEKAIADLLLEISGRLKRLADLMERDLVESDTAGLPYVKEERR